MSVQFAISGASAEEIAGSVERAVASGVLSPGTKLPSVRTLADSLDVSPTTVASALAELRRRGVVVSRARSATRVADRPPLRSPRAPSPLPPGTRDLALGNPDPAFLPDLAPALTALASGASTRGSGSAAATQRGPFAQRLYGEAPVDGGLAELARAAFIADGVAAERVVVVNGALDGIERVLAAQLAPGDLLAVEDPGWPGVLDLARALGLRLAPVTVDGRGMRPESLAAALAAGARGAIVTPRGHNPLGAALDAERAGELRELLRDVLVVEDDHLGPVAGVPYCSATGAGGRWAVVRSVSKWLGPDLRCAVLTADELTLARVEGRLSLGPGWVSSILQRLAARLWADSEIAALVRRAADVYSTRRAALVHALAAHGIAAEGRSGLNVWVPVPDEDAAVRALLGHGVAVAAGAPFRLEAGPAVRVTIATLELEEAAPLAAALAAAVDPPRRTRAA
ncbi:aminotransferase class I/II-fold pyridoxal phosphate-dependent enzyme [Solirubrobacter sp. CPCC 204708]|uniref:Aminotransferase class I/II-fold pyridoxal phosphate-dependent enzyme n=1 Tax=Solirubrobacter deserti TaxID=2282478 RepID=A0ABT4RRG6_9ACTN|nr:aminotransferase class I/II-fold pyridoxal phosphate-dependent enzyme [Solirubrobacter deserti]MBE2314733.1 aminotransferase class I/II-fold pyridoxal phosphate-dependent enzyme [Solirubrobacter deserti]MDA0141050.1 aminotransferase class I/II-fold pyridoxal phosphate-dependent enzyme [Solirubrobacter deserti]